MILVITKSSDTTADYVLKRMAERHIPFLRLNSDMFGRDTRVTLAYDAPYTCTLHEKNRSLRAENITSVWLRRISKPEMPVIEDQDARRFAEQELDFTLRWFIDALDCPIVDREADMIRARNKFTQLRLAHSLGFTIPDTLITNVPDDARRFALERKSLIVKCVAGYSRQLPGGFEAIYTNSFSDEMYADIESVALAPVCFQEKIEKQFELRITVIGEKLFGCRIDSQATERTKTDWRRYDPGNTPHRPYMVDDELAEKLLDMMRHFNIRFASFDMIVTPEGQTFFLEMNPGSQFVWIEELTGLPITDSLIDELKMR